MTELGANLAEQVYGSDIAGDVGDTVAAEQRQKPSRGDRAGVIVATLASLRIHSYSRELVDTITEQVKLFDEVQQTDAENGGPEVLTGYSLDLDPDVLTRDGLLGRYRAAGHKAFKPWAELWSQFSDVELNKRSIVERVTAPAQPFQGRVVGWLQGGDHPGEAGLYFGTKTWSEQQKAAQAKIDEYARDRTATGLFLPSYGDFVFAHAAEAETRDGVVLDAKTVSRLVQHDCGKVGTHPAFGPRIGMCGDTLYSGWSNDSGLSGYGVRFLMLQTQNVQRL